MKKSLIILIATFFSISIYGQTTRYIKPIATGTGDGSSWANASADLQAMINASVANDEVWVATGTYMPTQEIDGTTDQSRFFTFFINTSGIKIYGGFAGSESTLSERNVITNTTILSGDIGIQNDASDNVYHVVYINPVSSSTFLDGFTISDGNANSSGGQGDGGGIYMPNFAGGSTSSITISNCTISDNNAATSGGGFLVYNVSGTISPTFNNCIFKNNTGAAGGAVNMISLAGTNNTSFNGCLFYDNTASSLGGAVYHDGDNSTANPTFTNCTFTENTNANGGAFYNRVINGTGQVTMTNCIVWSNGNTNIGENASTTTGFVINHSIYDDGTIDGSVTLPSFITGSNNLDADPLFRNATNNDFVLSVSSPALNIGDNTVWTVTGLTTDLIGNTRPQDVTVDLGAYEVGLPTTTDYFITTWTTTTANESITIPTNSGQSYNYYIDWGDGNISTNQTGDATHTYVTAGTYTVKIYDLFPQIDFFNHNGTSANKIQTIEQWGKIEWASMSGAFFNCSNLTITNASIDAPDLTNVTSLAYMFSDCSNFNGGNLNSWDVSNILTTQDMFSGTTVFNQPLNSWNVNSVTNMSSMFGGATAFNQNLGNWNIINVSTMSNMLDNSGMDTDNYDNTLNGWAGKTVQNGVNLGATGLIYCSSKVARQSLTTDDSWNITGDGILNCACPTTTSTGQWTGCAGDGLWITAANWYGDILPTFTTNVIIDNGDVVTLSSSTVTVNTIYLSNDSHLTINSGVVLNVTNSSNTNTIRLYNEDTKLTNSGTLNITGGFDGIYNESSDFTNQTGGVVSISSVSSYGYTTTDDKSEFKNYGTLSVNNANIGINEKGSFNNYATGIINLSNLSIRGLLYLSLSDQLENDGQININSVSSSSAILSTYLLNNGQINIDGIGSDAINSYFELNNKGTITITNTGNDGISGNNSRFINSGTVTITGSTNLAMDYTVGSGSLFDNTGTIKGTGTFIIDNQSIEGTLSPETSSGTMTFLNNQTFAASNTIQLDINGTTAGTNHDQIIVNGTATISGTLNATFGYAYQNGDRIVIISATTVSGTFSSHNLPADWSIDYSQTGEVALIYSGVSLPVELLDFNAELQDKNVLLTWQTASELNNSDFDIEWSTNGISFEKIGQVQGAGTTNDITFYDFLHTSPALGLNYYRLKQSDFDGKFEYSEIIQVTIEQSNHSTINVYPNPAANFITIDGIEEDEIIQIFNVNGQLVKTFYQNVSTPQNDINDLSAGTYFIKMKSQVKKLIITK